MVARLFALALAGSICLSAAPFAASPAFVAAAADCVANNNLSETAQSFISRCRKGSINSEFPGQFYGATLGALKAGSSADHKKAWKLLNDSRFAK